MPDIGCEDFDIDISLQRPKSKKPGRIIAVENVRPSSLQNIPKDVSFQDLLSPLDSTEITSFNKNKTIIESSTSLLKSPDENYFAASPKNSTPSNVYRSADCNELLQDELEKLDMSDKNSEEVKIPRNMISQNSIEIEMVDDDAEKPEEPKQEEYLGEVKSHLTFKLT